MRRLIAALTLTLIIAAVAVIGTTGTASAAPCTVPNVTNPATGKVYKYFYVSWSPRAGISRAVCYNVGVVGTPNGYYFTEYVQDVVDMSTTPGGVSDDEGNAILQWRYCDGRSGSNWTNVAWDWDSKNWNYNDFNGGQVAKSPWLTAGANGLPTDFCFRLVATTRWKDSIYLWHTDVDTPAGTVGFNRNYW